ncbi:MAG: HNH endonuclease [candidate division Zixibacteria bacterium]|nr:HNH endonuclease [candidate division Zixibacteria bacterium]
MKKQTIIVSHSSAYDRESEELFEKIEARNYDDSCCFLCGNEIKATSRSVEHVIPKWLQRKYNLWNQKLTLLNGTKLPYRSLTIPCCKKCNNEYLRPIEDKIKLYVDAGFDKFKRIDRTTLYYWLSKIFYGILYKELFLLVDRKNPMAGQILTPDFLDQFKAHYLFMQGIRKKHQLKGFLPASIFIFRAQELKNRDDQWDIVDNIPGMTLGLRMNKIAVVAALQDGGAQKSFRGLYGDFSRVNLHPIQFREVFSQIAYSSILFNRTPKYVSFANGKVATTIQMPLGGLSSKPLFDHWDNSVYSKLLSHYTGLPLDIVNPQPGLVRSWIRNNEGKLYFIDANK